MRKAKKKVGRPKKQTIKETMHDFGKLGKWSESTLKQNLSYKNDEEFDDNTRCWVSVKIPIVKMIEESYSSLSVDLGKRIDSLRSQKAPKNLGKLSINLGNLRRLVDENNSLEGDYELYQKIMKKI
jgi:hypothetical protein